MSSDVVLRPIHPHVLHLICTATFCLFVFLSILSTAYLHCLSFLIVVLAYLELVLVRRSRAAFFHAYKMIHFAPDSPLDCSWSSQVLAEKALVRTDILAFYLYTLLMVLSDGPHACRLRLRPRNSGDKFLWLCDSITATEIMAKAVEGLLEVSESDAERGVPFQWLFYYDVQPDYVVHESSTLPTSWSCLFPSSSDTSGPSWRA